jgi:hypothetical protein
MLIRAANTWASYLASDDLVLNAVLTELAQR